jgi:hypothetical protein
MDPTYAWFLVVLIHAVACPGKCADTPGVQLKMPSQAVCEQVKADNPDVGGLDCWAKKSSKGG